ncbi:MAG: sigma-54 dependent transcriptional regulator [Thermodesulfobacteriota bacterium]|nr:sigma-54 dependent transcriptional regulator [Thermodesulfobacteriota bacterium]
MTRILVVDDEEKICFAFEQFLNDKGHHPLIASSAEDALRIVQEEKPHIVFLDIRLPGLSGLTALEEIQKKSPESLVVVMTAYGTMDTAIQAMRYGAYEYLTKPIDLDHVNKLITKMLRAREISPLSQAAHLEEMIDSEENPLIGQSQAIQDIYKTIGLLTTNDVPVLIEGESGVGKELVARAIHFKSERKGFPFVAINCGAMPEHLLETELFGHEKGAFTGAETQKVGKFEYAAEGTIFLDEIGDLQFPLQIKLLRVLQEKHLVRVGGLKTIPVRARVITATNKNLADEVHQGKFRSDLYYRLQLITLNIPPLRERKEDIPLLVDYFIRKSNRELGKSIRGVETSAMKVLRAHEWPGNVRELENVIKRAAILTRGETLGIHRLDLFTEADRKHEDLTEAMVERTAQKWFREMSPSLKTHGQFYKTIMSTLEKTFIKEALVVCEHNQAKASRILGINRATLRKKMKEYDLTEYE